MSRTSLQRGFSDPLLPPHTCKCRPRKRRTAAELLVFRFFWAVQLGVRSADRLTDLSLVLRLVSASTLWLGCCHQPGGSQALLQCRDQRKEESKQWLVICVSSWRQNKRLELWFWLLSLLGTCDLFSFTDVCHWSSSCQDGWLHPTRVLIADAIFYKTLSKPTILISF